MELLKPLLKPIWESPYGIITRGVFFELSEYITNYRGEKEKFKRVMGYDLDIENPRSFSHRIVRKKIYDRNPLLPIIADKFRVRQYLKDTLGEREASEILVPLLYHGSNPEDIPFDVLNGEYIIKANHNSGPNFIVENGSAIDKQKIVSSLRRQLSAPYGVLKHEWAYKKINKRMVVVERLLRDIDGNIPKDYKFHMINGICAFVQVDFERFIDHSRTLYTKDWVYIEGTLKFKQGRKIDKPLNFDRMLALANKLSKGFDYIRVDLYDTGERIYVGEMTHYPGSGMEVFTPQSLDFDLNKYWQK